MPRKPIRCVARAPSKIPSFSPIPLPRASPAAARYPGPNVPQWIRSSFSALPRQGAALERTVRRILLFPDFAQLGKCCGGVRSPLSIQQPKEQGQYETYHQAGHDRDGEGHAAAFERQIAGQPAETKLAEPRP